MNERKRELFYLFEFRNKKKKKKLKEFQIKTIKFALFDYNSSFKSNINSEKVCLRKVFFILKKFLVPRFRFSIEKN